MGTLLLAGALSFVIGAILGLLGGGGGILAVPMLVYLVGLDPKAAIAASLFFVGTTSFVGFGLHARAKRVRWKIGSVFGAISMAGAYLGGRLAQYAPARVLLVLLGGVMLITALAMLRKRPEGEPAPQAVKLPRVLAVGFAVGIVSGLVGVGGGFLIVPALTLFGGLAIQEAIATSLFVIALQSYAGFAAHISHVRLDWRLIAVMTGAAAVGTLAGFNLGKHISAHGLKRAFAGLVFVTGVFMLARQLPALWASLIAAAAFVAALLVTRHKPTPHPPIPTTEKECINSVHSQL